MKPLAAGDTFRNAKGDLLWLTADPDPRPGPRGERVAVIRTKSGTALLSGMVPTSELRFRYAADWQPLTTPDALDAIVGLGATRMHAADGQHRGLLPTEYDWLASEERVQLHRLIARARTDESESLDAIKARVALKRAERLAA